MIAKTFFNCGRELTGARRMALAVTLASSFGIQAADNLAAHAHGEAQLQVAVSGQTLDLIMESPAANLIGFEHRPRTKAQQEALDTARDWLTNTALIDTEDKASCRVLDASVMHSLMASEDRHSNDNHGHEGHSEHKEDKPGTSHSEFVVSQSLECQDLTPGRTLTTPLLGRFPGIERLQLQWVSAKGQGSADLKADDNRFQLRQ
ncbi:MAG: DUF2796 domain-containing protein [Oleiphilaceae bacterium]|nr:DUF2796 domain-containing protein [Oleiphilaceae bacterium]